MNPLLEDTLVLLLILIHFIIWTVLNHIHSHCLDQIFILLSVIIILYECQYLIKARKDLFVIYFVRIEAVVLEQQFIVDQFWLIIHSLRLIIIYQLVQNGSETVLRITELKSSLQYLWIVPSEMFIIHIVIHLIIVLTIPTPPYLQFFLHFLLIHILL